MTRETEADGERGEETNQRVSFTRRDVMKVAGASAVVVSGTAGVGSAEISGKCDPITANEIQCDGIIREGCSYCKIDSEDIVAGETYINVGGTNASITISEDGECATVTDPVGGGELCEVVLKAGSGDGSCTYITREQFGTQICTLNSKEISHITVAYDCPDCPGCVYSIDDADYYVDSADCETVSVCAPEATTECPVTATVSFTPVESDVSCPSKSVTLPTSGGETCADVGVDDCCEPSQVVFTDSEGNTLDTDPIDVNCGFHDDAFGTVTASCDEVNVCVKNTDDCPVTARLHLAGTNCDQEYIDREVTTDDDPSTDDCVTFTDADIPDCCAPQYVEILESDIRYPSSGTFEVGNCGYENDAITDVTADCDEVTVCATGVSDCPSQITLYLGEECEPSSITKNVALDPEDPDCVTFTDEEIPGCCTPQRVALEDPSGEVEFDSHILNLTGCGYDDLDAYLGDTVNCDEVEICVTGVECDVTAVLRTMGPECPEADPSYTFTNADTTPSGELCHTFTLGDCCTPTHVEILDEGGNVLERLPESGYLDTGELCGYDDLTVDNVEFCCDSVSFDLGGVECDVEATLDVTGDCDVGTNTNPITSDGTVTFEWDGCCTPQSVLLETTDGTDLGTVTPSSALDCVCDDTATCKFEPNARDFPSSFECDGVTLDVVSTTTEDGEVTCFTVDVSGGSLLSVDVKGGPDTNDYDFGCAGATDDVQLCAPINSRTGKRYGVSNFEVTVCTEALTTDCVGGSFTEV